MPDSADPGQTNRLQELLRSLAKSYMERRQYAEAYDKLQQLIRLGHDSEEILLDAAISAIGVNDISEEAFSIYKRALNVNPDSVPLLLGLATLFMQEQVRTEFALTTCRRAADLSPANRHQIYSYLNEGAGPEQPSMTTATTESTGVAGKATKDRKVIEALWWQRKFEESRVAIEGLARLSSKQRSRYLALSTAYEVLSQEDTIRDGETREQVLSAFKALNPTTSLQELRDYLVLRMALSVDENEGLEEFMFILGLIQTEEYFDFLKDCRPGQEGAKRFELLGETFPAAEQEQGTLEQSDPESSESILVAELGTFHESTAEPRIIELVETHLANMSGGITRRFGSGFLSFSRDVQVQVATITKLLNSLERFNQVTQAEKIQFNCGILALPRRKTYPPSFILSQLVCATHLLRTASARNQELNSTGTLCFCAEKAVVGRTKQQGVPLIGGKRRRVLPGYDKRCFEIIWRNPLAHVSQQNRYQLSDFEIHKQLVRHSTYSTYLGADTRLQRNIIIKIIPPQHSVVYTSSDAALSKLLQRIRAVAALSHPNIATLFDLGQQDSMIFVAREYIDGNPLTRHSFSGPDREENIVGLLLRLIHALTYAHAHSIMHLNLKPSNIWISDAGTVKVTDFRFAGFVNNTLPDRSPLPEATRYLAPEVLSDSPCDIRSDIYSFSVIAYELVSGRHPFSNFEAQPDPKIRPLTTKDTAHYEDWNDVLLNGIEPQPGRRHQSFTGVESRLKKIQLKLFQAKAR